jgi:oligopeptide transport system substrate-binding protein
VALRGGTGDLARNPADASERLEDRFVRSPAQVHTSPGGWTFFAVLDTRVPPFDDVDVRRAMNVALDRDRNVGSSAA